MESFSGHLHTRKIFNGNGFKNPYDGVLKGQKNGAPKISASVEDYKEIFALPQGDSTIPVLDLSGRDDPNGSDKLRGSKPDYSNIFGGFREDDDGFVSYEELFGRVNGVKNSPGKVRTTSVRRQPSQDSEDLFDTSNQSADALKQFNMSYHKSIPTSKVGSNGTTHVAQLQDVPGFTCFIDESKVASSVKAEAETQKSSSVNGSHHKTDGRPEKENREKTSKQTSGTESAVKSKSRYSRGGSFSDDKLFNAKSQPSKLPSHSFMPPYSENHQARFSGPIFSNSGAPEVDVAGSDEELDVNSAAAASVAALKKAIEKAQESIRLAKESVGRKKEGLQSFSNKSFKDSLKVKGREPTDKKNAERKCGKMDTASEVLDLVKKKNASNGVGRRDFKDGDRLFAARKVVDEIHEKIAESAWERERPPGSAPELKESERVSVYREVQNKTNGRDQESVEKVEASTWSSLEKGSSVGSAYKQPVSGINLESADYHESKLEVRTNNKTVGAQDSVEKLDVAEKSCEEEDMERKPNAEVSLHKLESACFVGEEKENGLRSSKQEEQEVLEKPHGFYKFVNFVKNFRGFVETIEDDKKVLNELKNDNNKVQESESHNFVNDESKLNDSREMKEDEQEDHLDYEKRSNQVSEQIEVGKEQEGVFEEKSIGKAENENEIGRDCDHDVNEKILEEVSQQVENEPKESNAGNESEKEDSHREESTERWQDEVLVLGINEKEQTYVHVMEEKEVTLQDGSNIKQDDNQKGDETYKFTEERDDNDEKDSEETLIEKCEWVEDDAVVTEDYIYRERETAANGNVGNEEIKEMEITQKVDYEDIFGRDSDGINHDMGSITAEIQETCKLEIDDNNVEVSLEANGSWRSPDVAKAFSEVEKEKVNVVEVTNRVQENDIFEADGQISSEDDASECEVKEVNEPFSSNECGGDDGLAEKEVGLNDIGETEEKSEFTTDGIEAVSNETTKIEERVKEETVFSQEAKKLFQKRAHWDLKGSHLPSTMENLSSTMEDKKDSENEIKKVEEKKQLRELDEATKRQREREKERIAAERVIREARERAYAEIREKAERAAVERATAEAQQRARAKIEKVSAERTSTKPSSSEKASNEAKIRAERAAVERATAEARERLLEKAMSQKATSTSERFVAEKSSGMRQSSSQKATATSERFVVEKSSGIWGSSSTDSRASTGINSESALRSKAKLERHNRIMERAAKALAEKEKRDMLVQIEQAERNRLAETLDAEIKRWSSGKEGNLRALLSTLQYILGSNSGWQPVSLTEIITTSAVKKAYRKATLVVHPDKLQQRGASIQQKYICEKVFDLLKAAWNRFSSEER